MNGTITFFYYDDMRAALEFYERVVGLTGTREEINRAQGLLGVAAVVDGEAGVEPDALGVAAQQPRADAVERPRPADRGRTLRRPAQHAAEDARRPPLHLHRGPARERQQQDPLRIGTPAHQVRDAMREGVGLARTGTGDDQHKFVGGVMNMLYKFL